MRETADDEGQKLGAQDVVLEAVRFGGADAGDGEKAALRPRERVSNALMMAEYNELTSFRRADSSSEAAVAYGCGKSGGSSRILRSKSSAVSFIASSWRC